MQTMHLAFSIGASIAPLVTSAVLAADEEGGDIGPSFFIQAVCALPFAVMCLWLPAPPPRGGGGGGHGGHGGGEEEEEPDAPREIKPRSDGAHSARSAAHACGHTHTQTHTRARLWGATCMQTTRMGAAAAWSSTRASRG